MSNACLLLALFCRYNSTRLEQLVAGPGTLLLSALYCFNPAIAATSGRWESFLLFSQYAEFYLALPYVRCPLYVDSVAKFSVTPNSRFSVLSFSNALYDTCVPNKVQVHLHFSIDSFVKYDNRSSCRSFIHSQIFAR